jgi:integrase
MNTEMKPSFRLFRRGWGVYYCQDTATGKQQSLGTRSRTEATQLLAAKNEAVRAPVLNFRMAQIYLSASDPALTSRSWQEVMDQAAQTRTGATRRRWERAMLQGAFDAIRHLTLAQTRAEHLLEVLQRGTVSTNVFLRRLHNFALDMNWLPGPVIPRQRWKEVARVRFREKRAITLEEHERILAGERNPEWLAYYRLLWHLGGSQSDVARLCAEDVDWDNRVIGFFRMKTGSVVQLHFGDELAALLSDLPGQGFLLPHLARMSESDRGSLFSRRCRLVGISGVSLHSYRYSWAERARTCGYPERFAQQALGHNSRAVHHAYARKAQVRVPSLEDYERQYRERTATRPPGPAAPQARADHPAPSGGR